MYLLHIQRYLLKKSYFCSKSSIESSIFSFSSIMMVHTILSCQNWLSSFVRKWYNSTVIKTKYNIIVMYDDKVQVNSGLANFQTIHHIINNIINGLKNINKIKKNLQIYFSIDILVPSFV